MPSKEPITSHSHIKAKSGLIKPKWRKVAIALASRYRRVRRIGDASLSWRRPPASVRWIRHHWIAAPGVMNWHLNFTLNARMTEPVREPYALPSRAQEDSPSFTFDSITAAVQLRRISHHFLMQRTILRHTNNERQSVMSLVNHDIHTTVRPIVRESSHFEHTLVVKAAHNRNRQPETGAPLRVLSNVTPMPQTPAFPAPMPQINISQIADQVMRQLDHRISSWRERRGRS
jgi:hypothetical protein